MKKLLTISFLLISFTGLSQIKWSGNWLRNIRTYHFGLTTSSNDTIVKIDSLKAKFFKPLRAGAYNTAGLPTATLFPGYLVYNTDSLKYAWSDGADWNYFGSGDGGSSAATLTDTYIGYGSGTNILTGDANITWNATNKQQVITTDAIGISIATTMGLRLRNTTAAAAGAQQYSPPIFQEGQGWKTNATAASQSVVSRVWTQPLQGAANPAGIYNIDFSINGASFSNALNVTSAGTLSVPGNIISTTGQVVASTNVRAGASSSLLFSSSTTLQAPADGILKITNSALTDFSRLQFGGTTSSFPSLKRSTTSLQVRLADDSNFGGFETGALITNSTITASGIVTGAVTDQILVHRPDSTIGQVPASLFVQQQFFSLAASAGSAFLNADSLQTTSDTMYTIEVHVNVNTTGVGDGAMTIKGTFHNVSGTLLQIGSTDISYDVGDNEGTVQFAISGEKVYIQVNSSALGVTERWKGWWTVWRSRLN